MVKFESFTSIKWGILKGAHSTRFLNAPICRNPSLGLATKVRVCKVAGQERSPKVTLHAPGSVGKCEGMNPRIPKGASTLGVKVSVDSRIFKEQLQGVKTQWIQELLISLESSWNVDV
jgi:hypothetical protein